MNRDVRIETPSTAPLIRQRLYVSFVSEAAGLGRARELAEFDRFCDVVPQGARAMTRRWTVPARRPAQTVLTPV